MNCKKKQPAIPNIPTGPSIGIINYNYTFTSSAADPYGDSISIRFDWDDGNISDWSPYVENGAEVSLSHCWSDTGEFYIKAQAKDINEVTSSWSSSHLMKISTTKSGWIKTYGGSHNDYGRSVQQTSDGGYIITGYTNSFGAGESDVYLIKTDENGNEVWTKTYGSNNSDGGNSVLQTLDRGYIVTGWTTPSNSNNSDVYIIKTDSCGYWSWKKTYGEIGSDVGQSIQPTSDLGYIIAGHTVSPVFYNDIYLIKTDANGILGWTKSYYGNSWEEAYSVQQTMDGGFIIVGYINLPDSFSDIYLVKTDINGNKTWQKTYGGRNFEYGRSIQQTIDDGYVFVGFTTSFGNGNWDIYLIKTDFSGNTAWTRTYGGKDNDLGYSVQQTTDGGYIIVGETKSFGAGNSDTYLIKTNSDGDTIWTKTFGGSEDDVGYSVQQTSDGGYIIAGWTSSFGAGLTDVYLIKTDANGNISKTAMNRMNSSKLRKSLSFLPPIEKK